MKRFLTICLFVAFFLHVGAQNDKASLKEEREMQEQIVQNQARFDEKTLDKVENIKTLVGKIICLRPDYVRNYHYRDLSGEELTIIISKTAILLNVPVTSSTTFGKKDRLEVVKAKKDELTVMRGDEKLKIPLKFFKEFMLADDAETITSSIIQEYRQQQINFAKAKQAAEEKVARDKAAAAEAVLQNNLKTYRESLNRMPKPVEGPIAVAIPERDYSGAEPYWKYKRHNRSEKLDTYLDEKFVLNPQKLSIAYKKGFNDSRLKQIEKLSNLQSDTFGIFGWHKFIDLRTGEVFVDNSLVEGMWESVHYLNLLNVIPAKTYDGTMSLRAIEKNGDVPYREKILQSLVGERVFLLDELKYDEILAVEETSIDGSFTLYLKDKGKYQYWSNNCISVKWYEQLQKFVGKKVIDSYELTFFGCNRIWREDLAKRETYTVVKFEVKDKRFNMYIQNDKGRSETVDAVLKCGLLAYPINVDQEWNNKQMSRKCLYDTDGYYSYDAVVATTGKKPADVKKQEALDKARSAEITAKMKKLREHRLIGTYVADFTREWPAARLLNTTTSGGITLQVYRLYDYQVVFRNGYCVSQTTY